MNTTSLKECSVTGAVVSLISVCFVGCIATCISQSDSVTTEIQAESFAVFMTVCMSLLMASVFGLMAADGTINAYHWLGFDGRIAQLCTYLGSIGITLVLFNVLFSVYAAPYFIS